MKNLFSERHGYIKPSDAIITERLTPEIINSICTCYDELENKFGYGSSFYKDLEEFIWVYFLHQRKNDYYGTYGGRRVFVTTYIKDNTVEWYKKLDMIEFTIRYLYALSKDGYNRHYLQFAGDFIKLLNYFFEDLNFGYRVIDKLIVPVTSEGEIKTIEEAIETSENNVSMHLHCALEKLSERPKGDYRNSIKESISAVEAYCRNITGKNTLGNALAEMEHNGLNLPASLKAAFLKLYGYTNSPDTGIRHPLMDVDGSYVPTADEAIYILISCSAFINYLRKKSVA